MGAHRRDRHAEDRADAVDRGPAHELTRHTAFRRRQRIDARQRVDIELQPGRRIDEEENGARRHPVLAQELVGTGQWRAPHHQWRPAVRARHLRRQREVFGPVDVAAQRLAHQPVEFRLRSMAAGCAQPAHVVIRRTGRQRDAVALGKQAVRSVVHKPDLSPCPQQHQRRRQSVQGLEAAGGTKIGIAQLEHRAQGQGQVARDQGMQGAVQVIEALAVGWVEDRAHGWQQIGIAAVEDDAGAKPADALVNQEVPVKGRARQLFIGHQVITEIGRAIAQQPALEAGAVPDILVHVFLAPGLQAPLAQVEGDDEAARTGRGRRREQGGRGGAMQPGNPLDRGRPALGFQSRCVDGFDGFTEIHQLAFVHARSCLSSLRCLTAAGAAATHHPRRR
mmetsp:Transcript_41229/g.96485  ORF Transcript_41229/g.96485 Transcript_41229/m.96485 type:complete len:392 (-) Transcript_41229:805-1980(-)